NLLFASPGSCRICRLPRRSRLKLANHSLCGDDIRVLIGKPETQILEPSSGLLRPRCGAERLAGNNHLRTGGVDTEKLRHRLELFLQLRLFRLDVLDVKFELCNPCPSLLEP